MWLWVWVWVCVRVSMCTSPSSQGFCKQIFSVGKSVDGHGQTIAMVLIGYAQLCIPYAPFSVLVCVCVRVCVRARARMCACACACVRVCTCGCTFFERVWDLGRIPNLLALVIYFIWLLFTTRVRTTSVVWLVSMRLQGLINSPLELPTGELASGFPGRSTKVSGIEYKCATVIVVLSLTL